jgi:hypothetical protein
VGDALEAVLDVMDYLDAQKAKNQAMNEVLDIQQRLHGFEGVLVLPHRLLLRESALINDGCAFLFSDLMLRCVKKKGGQVHALDQVMLCYVEEAVDRGSMEVIIKAGYKTIVRVCSAVSSSLWVDAH